MTDEFRKQLDALMGTNRNGDQGKQKHFDDPDVCKFYLMGICPHDLFTNTKMDMGECRKNHSELLKQDFEEARKTKDYGYDLELEREFERIVADCDRKIVKAQQRLEEMEGPAVPQENQISDERITEEIAKLLAQAERLGEDGKVDESIELMNRAEQLKERKSAPPLPPPIALDGLAPGSQQQKLRVCEICSAYLSLYDSDRRLADHFGGKLHVGYLLIREKLKELKAKRALNRDLAPVPHPQEREKERPRYDNRDRYSSSRRGDRDSRDTRDHRDYNRDSRDNRDYNRDRRDYRQQSYRGERRRPYD